MPEVVMDEATTTDREAFLLERKKGVGGSDIAAVFNMGYGCRLRLWRDKRDEVPDFPPEENNAMELGAFLEPYFAAKYEQATNRNVDVHYRPVIHPLYPELRVNIDRAVMPDVNGQDEDRHPGVLEIKSVGRGMFYKIKREGLPPDYIFQLQHGIECFESTWGAFAIGCRDNGELLYWDVQKDHALAQKIVEEARAFWQEVQSGEMPARLEPDDLRCQRCEYRRSCQGNALIQIERNSDVAHDETLAPLVHEYKERQELLGQAEALVEETKEELKTTLGDRQAIIADKSTVYFRPQKNERGDYKELAKAYDALRDLVRHGSSNQPETQDLLMQQYPASDAFKKAYTTRPLRIY